MDPIKYFKPFARGKKVTRGAAQKWLLDHDIELQRYLDKTYSHDSKAEAFQKYFWEDPFLGVEKTLDHMVKNHIKIKLLKKILYSMDFGIILFIGYWQTGKTVAMFQFAKWLKDNGRKITWHGPPRNLPEFVDRSTMDANSIPVGDVVISDEASVREYARDAMTSSSRNMGRTLGTLSHQRQLWLKGTQTTAQTDKYNVQLPRMVVAKTMTAGQLRHERDFIKDLSDWIPRTSDKRVTFIHNEHNPRLNMTVNIELPEWWEKKYSFFFEKFEKREDALEYARNLWEIYQGDPDAIKKIQYELNLMRYPIPENELCRELGIEG